MKLQIIYGRILTFDPKQHYLVDDIHNVDYKVYYCKGHNVKSSYPKQGFFLCRIEEGTCYIYRFAPYEGKL